MDFNRMGFVLGVLVVSFFVVWSLDVLCKQDAQKIATVNFFAKDSAVKINKSFSSKEDKNNTIKRDDQRTVEVFNHVKNGDLDGLIKAFESGYDLNVVDSQGKTLIYVATCENNLEILKYIVENAGNENINTVSFGWTPLYNAAYNNNFEMVKFLIEHGAAKSVTKDNAFGRMPLYWAVRNNNLLMAQILLKNGAEKFINKETVFFGGTNLYWAVYNGNLAMVKLLIQNGADVNKTTRYDESFLYWVCKYNREDILNYAITELVAVLDVKSFVRANKFTSETPLYWACYNDNEFMAQVLIQRGASSTINTMAKEEDKSAIYWAVKKGNIKMIKFLMDNGAKVDKVTIEASLSNAKVHKYLMTCIG